MRTTARILATVSLLLMGSLAMPVAAAVTELPQPEWMAAYDAAVAASGTLAPGTMLTIASRTEPSEESLSLSVNPDGSLTGERTTPNGMDRIRCVRVDRCWQQSAAIYGNAKWHRLPAGSVVYQPAAEYWATEVMRMPWPEGGIYFTETTEGGVLMYVAVRGDEVNAEITTMSTTPPLMTVVDMTILQSTPVRSSITLAVSSPPTPVTAPARATIGRPASLPDYWKVPINSG